MPSYCSNKWGELMRFDIWHPCSIHPLKVHFRPVFILCRFAHAQKIWGRPALWRSDMKNDPRIDFIRELPFGMSTFVSCTLTVSDMVLKVWIQIITIPARSLEKGGLNIGWSLLQLATRVKLCSSLLNYSPPNDSHKSKWRYIGQCTLPTSPQY